MLWAAACIGFFGFLRAGEFTVPSPEAYDPEVHLNLGDLTLDSHTHPTLVRLKIKHSKTDPFRQGVDVFLGRTDTPLCPVQALIPISGGALPNTRPLVRSLYRISPIKESSSGKTYTRHSGKQAWMNQDTMATVFELGLQRLLLHRALKTPSSRHWARWRSEAYKIYIKFPRAQLASVSRALARGQCTAILGTYVYAYHVTWPCY